MKRSNKKEQKGFTLIELLVTIAIIAFVATTFTVSYSRANNRTKLTMTAYKMASDIRLAQSYALGLKKKDGDYYRWGIAVSSVSPNNRSYVIFADKNNNGAFDAGLGEAELTVNLPAGVWVGSFSPVGSNNVILYASPDPIVNILRDGISVNTTIINLIDSQGSTKSIIVNKYGLVEVVD